MTKTDTQQDFVTEFVRAPLPSDFNSVMLLAKTCFETSVYSSFGRFDIDEVTTDFYAAQMNDPNYFGRVLVDKQSNLVGFFLGYLGKIPYTKGLMACDKILFTAPNNPNPAQVISVIKLFEDWAKSKGALYILLGVSHGRDNERASKLYDRLGYTDTFPVHRRRL